MLFNPKHHLNSIKKLTFFCVLSINCQSVLALSLPLKSPKQQHLIMQLGGYLASYGSQDQHININGLIGDKFTPTNKQNGNGLVGIGYFIDGQSRERFNLSYGINAFYLPRTHVTGTVIQENLFSNLSYGYGITQYPLYAIAKSTINTSFDNRHITLDVGIGPNFITTSDFKEHSIDGSTTLPDTIFSGKTSTQFSATAGVGLKFDHFFGEAPLECGYRFFYLGSSNLNIINDQVQNALKTGTIYGNALMCSISI